MDATVRAIAVIEGAGAWLGRGKYLVVVGDSSSRLEPQTFSPSVFRGADRVDLEDVLEFGGYDTIAVRPRRGKFAAAEAGRILREVVLEDLTFDH